MKLSQMRHYCIYWRLGVSYPTEQEKAEKEEGKGLGGWREREEAERKSRCYHQSATNVLQCLLQVAHVQSLPKMPLLSVETDQN